MAREDIKAGDFLNTGTNGALGDADRAEDGGWEPQLDRQAYPLSTY